MTNKTKTKGTKRAVKKATPTFKMEIEKRGGKVTSAKITIIDRMENRRANKSYRPYLYAAYGMNTSMGSMMGRCPFAKAVGIVTLHDHALAFRGVADVITAKGREIQLALWEITEGCEKSLDALEGYRPTGQGLYDKRYFTIGGEGPLSGQRAMIYVMTSRHSLSEPSRSYEDLLREGYTDFGMDHEQIDRAIREAVAYEASDDPPGSRGYSIDRYRSDDLFIGDQS